MDWDDTKIVFTKRSLIDFLKYVNVTVDTNFSQIAKLPRYAEFATVSGEPSSEAAVSAETSAPKAVPETAPANPANPSWKPTRRVRTAPGGAQTFHLGDDEPEPVAPPPHAQAPTEPAKSEYRVVDNDGNLFKPTRRVRTAPGGHDSIGAFFGGD
ncbi:hypothetical protein CTheo_893 [Ceratobasidium theobromae]|uniref:Uncharacterized protein n=1 Tax=Ceratobasidium theobromae TaxID=1582974 RepID=A0A5N5QV64_9AGAM|nr:hypothetical protein CTheo_893 [Ceratobasidium theobromae]